MSGLPGRGGKLSIGQRPHQSVQIFPAAQQFGNRVAIPDQMSFGSHSNQTYLGSMSPEGYDTDMVDAAAGSSTAVSNAASPEDGDNEDDSKSNKKSGKMRTKMAAIPEYFASKKTKGKHDAKPSYYGKVPKKRGPKPDSKPARDRRQELNRQAQRNHRHRKEEQQKWLEEALTEAHDKARAAMKRAQEAEELNQHVFRGNEHLLRENERLKQLLEVNKIPFEHVIPPPDKLGIDSTQQAPTTQQHAAFTSHTTAPQNPTSNAFATTPATYTTAPPSSTTTIFSTGPLSVQSSATDMSLDGMNLHSSVSPVSPTDGAYEASKPSNVPPVLGYGSSFNGQQHILQIEQASDSLTGQSSGPITSHDPAAASMPCGPVASNYCTTPSMPSYGQSSNLLGDIYSDLLANANQNFVDNIDSTRLENIEREDTFAIADHDQAGVEFVLALEANCHDHKTLMNARTFNDPIQLGGHSLMLTKVPISVAKKYRTGDAPYPHQLPDVGDGPGKYARLLSLVSLKPYSTNKNWATQTGEITPAQALGMIRKDPRYPMLNSKDFTKVTHNLKDRCRCYGFGAVVEVYEVKDALDDVFNEKGYGPDDGYDLDSPFWTRIPLSNPHTLNGPEFPALDGLMDFQIAGLMSNRHSDREQFLSADLSTFNIPASNIQHPVDGHQSHPVRVPSVHMHSNSAGFSQIPTFNTESATVIRRPSCGQTPSETADAYQHVSSELSTFDSQHARDH